MVMGELALRGSRPSGEAAPEGGLGLVSEGVVFGSCLTLGNPFIIDALCGGVLRSACSPSAPATSVCGESEGVLSKLVLERLLRVIE